MVNKPSMNLDDAGNTAAKVARRNFQRPGKLDRDEAFELDVGRREVRPIRQRAECRTSVARREASKALHGLRRDRRCHRCRCYSLVMWRAVERRSGGPKPARLARCQRCSRVASSRADGGQCWRSASGPTSVRSEPSGSGYGAYTLGHVLRVQVLGSLLSFLSWRS